MKYTIALLAMIAALAVVPMSAPASDAIRQYASSGQSGVFRYSVFNNRWLMTKDASAKLAAITGLSADAKGDIVIPPSLDGFTIHGIDERAFASCKGITSIAIPKTVTFLRPGTLNRCQGLKNVFVDSEHPEFCSVDGVMFNKKKTELLFYGSGRKPVYAVPKTTTAIGSYAFSLCKDLKKVSIPPSVTQIGGRHGRVFFGCSGLERIELPETVTEIGQMSFRDCASLMEVKLSPKITAIPFGLFWNCPNLVAVTLPDGITSIGNYAFADCKKLMLRSLPKKLTRIGAYAFKNCKSLNHVTIPKGATSIGRGAFLGTGVVVPKKPKPGDGK